MDSFAEQEEYDDDNILQRPMQAYNRCVENIQLPELLFDENSDTSECEEESEPLIFHPVLDKQTISFSAATDQPLSQNPDQPLSQNPVSDDAPKQCAGVNLPTITLSDADLAEMELDNAILSLAPSNPLDGKVEHDFSSLSDSSSSGSSLLGELEETMAKLKREEEEHLCNLKDNGGKSSLTMNHMSPEEGVCLQSDLVVEQETVKVDLRLSQQVPTNRCVFERYGSKPYSGDDEDEDAEELRQNIKRESQHILLNKGIQII